MHDCKRLVQQKGFKLPELDGEELYINAPTYTCKEDLSMLTNHHYEWRR